MAPAQAPAAGASGAPVVFSEAVFGARLARALDALLAMQRADAAQIARGPRGPLAALFTTPTGGPSLFEADSLTLHFLCGGVSLGALVEHHRGALPHVTEALDGLEIVDVRALPQPRQRPPRRPRRPRRPEARRRRSPAARVAPGAPNKNRSVSSRFPARPRAPSAPSRALAEGDRALAAH